VEFVKMMAAFADILKVGLQMQRTTAVLSRNAHAGGDDGRYL
jgi:hypothetical protein